MHLTQSTKQFCLRSVSLLVIFALMPGVLASNSHTQSIKKPKYNKFCLVPPPPPYVPSMLPELSRYRGYGQSSYVSLAEQSGTSPRIYKPNKYLTYCYPNK